jgi:hypothetical protein
MLSPDGGHRTVPPSVSRQYTYRVPNVGTESQTETFAS